MSSPIELYTDGSSLRNPGASGLAYIIRYWSDPEHTGPSDATNIEFSQAYRLSTNNRMEIMAVIEGVNAILENIKSGTFDGVQINVFTDSEYVCNAINQNWISKWQSNNWMTSGFRKPPSPVKNKDLWEKVVGLQREVRDSGMTLTITHVQGHSDNEFNNRCDQLAVDASNNGDKYLVDQVYEDSVNNTQHKWG